MRCKWESCSDSPLSAFTFSGQSWRMAGRAPARALAAAALAAVPLIRQPLTLLYPPIQPFHHSLFCCLPSCAPARHSFCSPPFLRNDVRCGPIPIPRLGEKRRDGTWDPETEAFGGGTSRGSGYRGIAAASSTGGWGGFESVEEPSGIVLNERSSVSHAATGRVAGDASHSVIGAASGSIASGGYAYQDSPGGGSGYALPSSPPPEL